MIQIALIVISSLAILVASLLNYAPNFKRVIDSDFMRRSYEYANYRGMEEAQLKHRAGNLPTQSTNITDVGCLYTDDRFCMKILGSTIVHTNGTISVQLNQAVTAVNR